MVRGEAWQLEAEPEPPPTTPVVVTTVPQQRSRTRGHCRPPKTPAQTPAASTEALDTLSQQDPFQQDSDLFQHWQDHATDLDGADNYDESDSYSSQPDSNDSE